MYFSVISIYWINLKTKSWVKLDHWNSMVTPGLDHAVHQCPLTVYRVELQNFIEFGWVIFTAYIFIITNCLMMQSAVSYLSLGLCCQYLPHGDQCEVMGALQYRPRLTQSPPAAQLRIERLNRHPSHQRPKMSEVLLLGYEKHHLKVSTNSVSVCFSDCQKLYIKL